MKINQIFKAHPIGQGFFYSGQISSNKTKFNFVFDCGSLTDHVLKDTIDRYKNEYLKNTLDLLIISHFDADHINGISYLLEGITVKKIIAPFIGFNQRLCIALNYFSDLDYDNSDEFIDNELKGILDFTTLLSDKAVKDTEIIFINPGNEKPYFDDDEFNVEKWNENFSDFHLDINSEDLLPDEISKLNFSKKENLKKIESNKVISISGALKILDLLFYRKKVSLNSNEFYDKVYDLFLETNKEQFANKKNPTIDDIVSIIKSFRGSTKIKELFQKAADEVDIYLTITEIKNLNTTALCMLHRNRLVRRKISRESFENFNFRINTSFFLNTVIKNNEFKTGILRRSDYFPNFKYIHLSGLDTLLTADSYLKKVDEIELFMNYYEEFINDIYIFQIPHHGSRNNSSKILFAQLPKVFNFINYGVNHRFIKRWSHPHNEVINDLISTGQTNKLLAVNEYSGYQLEHNFQISRR